GWGSRVDGQRGVPGPLAGAEALAGGAGRVHRVAHFRDRLPPRSAYFSVAGCFQLAGWLWGQVCNLPTPSKLQTCSHMDARTLAMTEADDLAERRLLEDFL